MIGSTRAILVRRGRLCFVDALELGDLGFDGVDPAATGRPAYHPSPMLKLYILRLSQPRSNRVGGWEA